MDQETYQHWWALHLRVARGEPLTPEERAAYDNGLAELDQRETMPRVGETARAMRATVAALAAEHAVLAARRQELDAEIARLEAALGKQARQLLGVEN